MTRPGPAQLRLGLCCQFAAEPLFHVSSPRDGWDGAKPQRHHDYIDPADFPVEWLGWPLTVEVEAKAKELAVARLRAALQGR